MASEIKLPELGENVEEGEVIEVKVAAGDEVREGQALLEVEAEKSSVEVPSPVAGRVTQVLVKKGDRVHTGQTLCLVETANAQKEAGPQTSEVPAKPEAKKEPAPQTQETAAPQARDVPAKPVAKKKPAPQTQETAAPKAAEPVLSRTVPAAAKDGQKDVSSPTPAVAAEKRLVPAGPATRRLARELGIDLSLVPGSAPAGRVTQEDVKAYVKQLATATGARPGSAKVAPLPKFEQWGPVERKPLDGIRRKTAEQMSLAWSLVPHVTQHDLADVTEIDTFRRQQEGKGPKLTVTAFALKAAAIVLRQFPQFNASLDLATTQLVLKHYYHIGVAVDTDRGLLVPVVRDVDKKSVQELAGELAELAERARHKKLAADDMKGGTFTISNLGSIGGTGFTPIVNYPEVAILGLARARLQPVAKDGQFVPRLLLPLSLSYDHRVIDGADAARFTRRLADMLENPMVMLLHA